MKIKIISLLLLLCLLFSLASCEATYEPIASTEEELATVMTIRYEGEEYAVPYELYRAFFLQLKSDVDGGNAAVWSGAEKDKYVEKIDGMILERIADVYATFHIAKRIGIDLYSEENEGILDDYIRAGVEGGTVDGMDFEGFEGDYDAYLASLREMNLNYSAQRTLLRYALASVLIDHYYIGSTDTPGELKYTEDDVREFYFGNDSARVIEGYFPEGTTNKTYDELVTLRERVANASTETEAALIIINAVTTVGDEILRGSIIGSHSRDSIYYSELTEAALSLSVGEASNLIRVSTGFEDGYYIIYKAEKSESNFEENKDYITGIYLEHRIGALVSKAKDDIINSIEKTEMLKGIDHSKISMP